MHNTTSGIQSVKIQQFHSGKFHWKPLRATGYSSAAGVVACWMVMLEANRERNGDNWLSEVY